MSEVRYQPVLNHGLARPFLGALVLLGSAYVVAYNAGLSTYGIGRLSGTLILLWIPTVVLTDRYRHKYPQRYYPYLLASHLKGALILSTLTLGVWLLQLPDAATRDLLWPSIIAFMALDLALSGPRQRVERRGPAARDNGVPADSNDSPAGAREDGARVLVAAGDLRESIASGVAAPLAYILQTYVPTAPRGTHSVGLIHDLDGGTHGAGDPDLGLLIGTLSLNHVDRLNNYLRHLSGRVVMGGHLLVHYTPMESTLADLRRRYPGARYSLAYAGQFLRYRALPKIPILDRLYFHPAFAWFDRGLRRLGFRRNRALTRAEVWGRLAYYGFEVLHESEADGARYVIAVRNSAPVTNRKPSFYAVVALEKVGLDGETIRLHKVRSMYPFSEFLQKKVFQSNGLSNTGKFRDDFRLTDYGPLIRKSWIDEIPGLFDWLRGDLKMVGMRATSPHYLSLYPPEIYDMYIKVKPGLIPPIFDEKTAGFDEIVEIERTYLSRYLQAPVRTDIQYFWFTFRDIFIRKVRSS